MPWFKVDASIEIEVEAADVLVAEDLARRVLDQCVLGHLPPRTNITEGELTTDPVRIIKCPDCGERGWKRGHFGCQYPSDDPNVEGLDDPMERER